MGIARNQLEQEKPAKIERWTFKELFQKLSPVISIFNDPFSICLLISIFFIGISEVIGHNVHWLFYLNTFFLALFSSTKKDINLPKKK